MTSAVGIDVGGTKIAVVRLDAATGSVLAREVVPTDRASGGEAILERCRTLARRHRAGDTRAIGIGVCELVDLEGRIRSANSFDWRDVDVSAHFADLAPTFVESDVRAAATAEARLGGGRADESFMFVGVGTGVSYALVEAGVVRRGARGNAIFVGTPMLERRSGGGVLAAELGADLVAAFELGASHPRVREAAADVGEAIGIVVNAIDPHLVVIGGGLGTTPGFHALLVDAIRATIYADDTRGLPIQPSSLGPDAGAIGAALVAIEHLGEPGRRLDGRATNLGADPDDPWQGRRPDR